MDRTACHDRPSNGQMEERMEHGEQVHLLLSAPGQPPATLPASTWRGWLPSERGPIDPVTAAKAIRLSPVSPRAEKALVSAVANDDVDALGRIAGQGGPAQDAARVLLGIRLATVDIAAAIEVLHQLAASPTEPTDGKILRKHWNDLAVEVNLAPSVPALVPIGRSALGLLAAELMVQVGRVNDAIALLETLPPRPPVALAKAAALLANGDHARVLEVTVSLPNIDDVSALALVARSVAARSQQDLPVALDAVCEALSDGDRSGAVLAAALEERAHLYSLAGDTVAAHADLEALAALAAGSADVTIPTPSTLRRSDDAAATEDDSLARARKRIARRITGVGAPGTFGGRHHSTYRDEIATMFALGQVDAVEELLLGLLDVVEDEVDELGVPLDATFFLTLADLYQDSSRTEDLHALRERYAAAETRAARRIADRAASTDDDDRVGVDLAKQAPAPAAVSAYMPPAPFAAAPPVEDDEILAHQLVSVLAAPAPASVADEPSRGEAPTSLAPATAPPGSALTPDVPPPPAAGIAPAAEPVTSPAAEPAVSPFAPAAVPAAPAAGPAAPVVAAGGAGPTGPAAEPAGSPVAPSPEDAAPAAPGAPGVPPGAEAVSLDATPIPAEDEPDDVPSEPVTEPSAGDEQPEEPDPGQLAPKRELTPVERAIRGPRVRSL
jgi:hypothetical protein